MLFGVNNKVKVVFFVLMLISFGNVSCAQSEEAKNEQSRQHQRKSNELRLQGKLEEAIIEQLKAVEITPNDLQAQSVLGSLYEQTARVKNKPEYIPKAKEALEKAIKIDPNDAVSHAIQADVLSQIKDKQGALRERLEAAKLEPANLKYLTDVGIQQNILGDNDSARITYRSVLQKNPNFIYALYHYAEVEAEDGNFDKAVDLFERAVNSEPSEADDEDFQQTARNRLTEVREKLKSKSPN